MTPFLAQSAYTTFVDDELQIWGGVLGNGVPN